MLSYWEYFILVQAHHVVYKLNFNNPTLPENLISCHALTEQICQYLKSVEKIKDISCLEQIN